ncbi:DUF7475 family protein [Halalkalicoccus tibetensis]|uniref:Uncharacterized protein n=1 Tax=Halalkalicoccus tibetensis TaxID=175632 RepID=A0ABD5VA47_9EURY
MTGPSRTETDAFDLAFLLSALVLAGIHLYLGLVAPFVAAGRTTQFVLIGLVLLVGPGLYFTSYWRPILYPLGVAVAVYLGVVWLLAGADYPRFGLAAGGTATVFAALALYLFVRGEATETTDVER